MPGDGARLSIVTDPANYAFTSVGAGPRYKAQPEAILFGQDMIEEMRRVMWTWSSRKEWSTSNTSFYVLGHHESLGLTGGSPSSGSVRDGVSYCTLNGNANGFYVWIKMGTVTALGDATIEVHGNRIFADGSTDGSTALRETITITSTTNQVYRTQYAYVGTPEFHPVTSGGLNAVITAAGNVDPWTHGGILRKFEALQAIFRPNASTWRFDITASRFSPGTTGTNGLNTLYTATFQDTDSPTRAQNGVSGRDFCMEINDVAEPADDDPDAGQEGFLIAINVKSIDLVDLWASFYQY